jgi:predicted phosphodiesterase
MSKDLIVYGDPHGCYEPLIAECKKKPVSHVLILGDMTDDYSECGNVTAIGEALAPILDMGIDLHWIPGNHDTDCEQHFDATYESLPNKNLHGKVAKLPNSGLRVAGLGGVFRGKVWYPDGSLEDPYQFYSPHEMMLETNSNSLFRNGIPLRHMSSIFPSQVDAIKSQKAEILICHEAPSSIKMGFIALDQLADDMNVKVILHGHHHTGYHSTLMNGIHVKGLGKREPFRISF